MTIPKHIGLQTGKKTSRKRNTTITPEMEAAQWKPGQSGNPSGRPHKTPFTDAIRELLAEDYKGSQRRFKGLANARVLAIKMFELALAGDMRATEEVANRVEGRTVQIQQLQGPGAGAIPFTDVSPRENERRIMELLAKTRTTGEEQ